MSVVFYFMNGCGACAATWPTWKKVKKMAKGPIREVEAKQVPSEANVRSFPTFVVENEDGQEVDRVEGRQMNARALMKRLGMKAKKTKGTLRRRSSRARTTRRNIR
jgi:hypothetical protein